MKKILSILSILTVAVFTLQSCTQPVDHAKEWASIDSLARMKFMHLADSLHMSCMNDVMAMAAWKADSAFMASQKGTSHYVPKPKPVVTNTEPVVAPPPVNPKSDKMSGTNTTNTQEKKDKMSGTDSSATLKKKNKMNGGEPPPPKQ